MINGKFPWRSSQSRKLTQSDNANYLYLFTMRLKHHSQFKKTYFQIGKKLCLVFNDCFISLIYNLYNVLEFYNHKTSNK